MRAAVVATTLTVEDWCHQICEAVRFRMEGTLARPK